MKAKCTIMLTLVSFSRCSAKAAAPERHPAKADARSRCENTVAALWRAARFAAARAAPSVQAAKLLLSTLHLTLLRTLPKKPLNKSLEG